MSKPTSSHAYGIGIIAMIVGLAAGISYYQLYYIPELTAKPKIAEEVLNPTEETLIHMVPGAANPQQQDNFVPKLVKDIQLGLNNKVTWENADQTPHTVTPDTPFKDKYSGDFGSLGVVKPDTKYEFLFTEHAEISYHCEPHPWMKGKIIITEKRF